MPPQPGRGSCRRAGSSTLTSWRSGRLGWSPSLEGASRPERRVPKTERADRLHPGGRLTRGRRGVGSGFGSPNSNSQPARRVAITRSTKTPAGAIAFGRVRFRRCGSRGHCASASADASGDWSIGGEFDPGSGSTLAACLMHASRARALSGVLRGGRVRNTWATCPGVGDSRGKPRVIPHTLLVSAGRSKKGASASPEEGPAAD